MLTWICWNHTNSINFLHQTKKVYTKVKNEEPTYYSDSSEVKLSQFASGSIVRGKVENSVISRNVDLSEGSSVSHSILFPRVKVAKGRDS